MLHPKKVGTIPVDGAANEVKQTNEIKVAIPLLDPLPLKGKYITADALHTQRDFARYLVEIKHAQYFFTVKGNQKTLQDDLELFFTNAIQSPPDASETSPCDHGRIETRNIWVTNALNDYLDFPHIGQAFALERVTTIKKTGKTRREIVYAITSATVDVVDPETMLKIVRGHWSIENSCHYILDWTFDEDRSRIRTGYGPENISRLRRFAIGLIKSKGEQQVTRKMRCLAFNVRTVLDYLKMSRNSRLGALCHSI